MRILKMVDRSDYGIATVAAVYGWGTSHMMAAWLALPMWAQSALQTLFTLALGLGMLTAQHFWRRYLRRRWPDEDPPQGEIPARARFDLFELFRRGMERLRKAKRRRKES
jgi:hypothetical protein